MKRTKIEDGDLREFVDWVTELFEFHDSGGDRWNSDEIIEGFYYVKEEAHLHYKDPDFLITNAKRAELEAANQSA